MGCLVLSNQLFDDNQFDDQLWWKKEILLFDNLKSIKYFVYLCNWKSVFKNNDQYIFLLTIPVVFKVWQDSPFGQNQ